MTGRPTSYTPETAEIYALRDPRTGCIRYIGKANDSAQRLKRHLRDAHRRDTPVYRWIRKLMSDGQAPVLEVLSKIPFAEWEKEERRLIAEHRLTARLLNVAEGGDQPFCSYEVRAENGRKACAARSSTEFKKRVWNLKRAIGLALKDGYVTEAQKEKIRYAARKRPDLFGIWANI